MEIGVGLDSDKTRFRPRPPTKSVNVVADFPIEVNCRDNRGEIKTRIFQTSFHIGRNPDCDIFINDNVVSRSHAQVYFESANWYIRDLKSTNGVYVQGRKISRYKIESACQISFGQEGPSISFGFPTDPSHPELEQSDSVTQFVKRYLKDDGDDKHEKANIVREAFKRESHKRVRKYRGVIAGILVLLAIAATFSYFQYRKIAKMDAIAIDIFYSMKGLELQILKSAAVEESKDPQTDPPPATAKEIEFDRLATKYDEYVASSELAKHSLNDRESLIIQMARVFGECELEMPKSFVNEVDRYIDRWQRGDSYREAIERADIYDFIPTAMDAFERYQLPRQFFYLGMAESGFRIDISGPKTRFGIAKGAWQFIPKTAVRYGLNVGPLADKRGFDALDDRFDVRKSTFAAARYLKEIYATDAQASGLLVMASYNWGEHNIVRLINKLPENPKDRNFWQLIKQYRIPQQTYDYVLSILAAAVIGENPRLFGFDFDNPLIQVDKRLEDPKTPSNAL